jgi:putative transposase
MRARGHFPTEQAALKRVYLAIMSLDPTGQGRRRWAIRWNPLGRQYWSCRYRAGCDRG